MSRRRDLPGLNDEATATLDEVREHLRMWRCETLEAVDLLHAHRAKVDAGAGLLENPKAVTEYLDAFVDLFSRAAADLAGIDAALEHGVLAGHVEALRQIASNAAVEQRRCLAFRDKCINKPLPHEEVRTLLNQISIDTRDQLLDYKDLSVAASRLEAMIGAPPGAAADERSFDRRSLFTRFLPKKGSL
jgi:hypothetical protein